MGQSTSSSIKQRPIQVPGGRRRAPPLPLKKSGGRSPFLLILLLFPYLALPRLTLPYPTLPYLQPHLSRPLLPSRIHHAVLRPLRKSLPINRCSGIDAVLRQPLSRFRFPLRLVVGSHA